MKANKMNIKNNTNNEFEPGDIIKTDRLINFDDQTRTSGALAIILSKECLDKSNNDSCYRIYLMDNGYICDCYKHYLVKYSKNKGNK